MQLGMVGLGRMGANMVRRLARNGHECIVFDRSAKTVEELAQEKGVGGSSSLADFVSKLTTPRAIWLMIPAAFVDDTIAEIVPHLQAGDILIDGGNSYYIDDIRRAKELAPKDINYVDVGTSGGVWGLERGYCMMIGGHKDVVAHLDPIFQTIAPGIGDIARTRGREGAPSQAEQGYLYCGESGGGHFVKMVHNGIEYGIMAAYAEGLQCRERYARDRRRNDASARPRALSIRIQPARGRRSLAARQRHRLMAARSHRRGSPRRPRALEVRWPRLRLRRRSLDREGSHRRGCAGTCSYHRTLRTIQLARTGRVP
jgi:6-phosphogluconate dehydrogenase (decarboxylating)